MNSSILSLIQLLLISLAIRVQYPLSNKRTSRYWDIAEDKAGERNLPFWDKPGQNLHDLLFILFSLKRDEVLSCLILLCRILGETGRDMGGRGGGEDSGKERRCQFLESTRHGQSLNCERRTSHPPVLWLYCDGFVPFLWYLRFTVKRAGQSSQLLEFSTDILNSGNRMCLLSKLCIRKQEDLEVLHDHHLPSV